MTTARDLDQPSLRNDTDRHLRRVFLGPRRELVIAARKRVAALCRTVLLGIWGVGFGLAIASAAIWLMPDGEPAHALLSMKLATALMFSALLAWFAGSGIRSELRFDTDAGVVREVMCRRRGDVEEVASWRFAEFDAVEIHVDGRDTARLSLRFNRTGRSLQIAKGGLPDLERMALRIERDTGMQLLIPLRRLKAAARGADRRSPLALNA